MNVLTRLRFRSEQKGIDKYIPKIEGLLNLPIGHTIDLPYAGPGSLKPGVYSVFDGPKDIVLRRDSSPVYPEGKMLRDYYLVYIGELK